MDARLQYTVDATVLYSDEAECPLCFWKKSYQEEVSARFKTEEQLAQAKEKIKELKSLLQEMLLDNSMTELSTHWINKINDTL
jgi:TolA-binding protein